MPWHSRVEDVHAIWSNEENKPSENEVRENEKRMKLFLGNLVFYLSSRLIY